MKTLRKTAEEAYLKYANKIINRETWIDGFISGIQYKKEYPQSIELCGLLWTQRIWPSAVTRRTAIITTHGVKRWKPRGPSGSACRPGRNGKHYAISARLGTTS